ncbi:amino ABC transporter, permease, 3-TM region, His/Glu/Gln/Arg/opine family domain protein [Ochrobactrum quorumnocens]|jgi:polar amino acid transport system permease protein|uniref:Amino ABC transporter, permease, 3-TM region, His/Glu/Gln/Arg/opine family domain protein n=2 Tax=Brucella/Ochrobactrum group TaxID=2826938 RepID=A0A256FP40_9HYPH|nr:MULTISPECIES: amino acid ABC transporter permease [Brucella]ASV83882.1 amino ABC transporter, permease, 3-TM region, His/Glu/Gln/Arg/opine family domain protein [[Ochrobactrum] quorumnocens]MBD7989228.1 amino acid ABC transporter permease [Ochrobactrum gallinarum]OYR16181.1 amino ABC transporter, permease, 3-TM region, His/Glu/Gln/Arg/opine family domain protein [Brucella rhizosphaerae]
MTFRTFGPDEFLFLLTGLQWTILLTAIALIGGGIAGFLIALARVSTMKWLRVAAGTYIQIIQGIPVLMILFLSYYGLSLAGFDLHPLLAAGASMSVYASGYLAEIWRGCIQSVPKQQWEASESLALTRVQQYRYVILPQAVRISLPSTVGFAVQVVKNTSIASIIGFVELARAGTLINNATFQPFRVFVVVAALYFAVCYPLSLLSRWLERRLNV